MPDEDQFKKLAGEIAGLRVELQLQKDLVAELLKRLYGARSEKIDTAQLLLDLQGDGPKKPGAADVQDAPAADPEPGGKKPKKPRRQKLRDSLKALPTVTTEIIPSEVLAAPEGYRRIDQEISERLEVSPAAFTRHVTVRPTYVKKGDPEAKPTTAPLPPALLEGSVLTASLGAHLLTEKFCYHQPFQRQEWRLRATHDIEISRNVMCHWHNHLADQLLPVYDLIAADMRGSDYLKVDETPIRYLDPGTGKTSTGQFWVYHHAEHGPLYDWHTSRAGTCLERVLLGRPGDDPFAGYLQSDGLRAYSKYIRGQPPGSVTPVSCLAHIRRKFVEAKGDHAKLTAWILYQIGRIYELERKLRTRGKPARAELRRRARRRYTRRHYDHLGKLIAHLQKKNQHHPREQTRESAELRPRPAAPPRALLRRRPGRVRQQPDRERHQADQARHEKLDVRRRGGHRLAQRRDLHDGRAGKAPRPRSLRLLQMGVRAPARDDQPGRLRPAAATQLGRGAESATRESGIDGRDAIALAKMLERLR